MCETSQQKALDGMDAFLKRLSHTQRIQNKKLSKSENHYKMYPQWRNAERRQISQIYTQ